MENDAFATLAQGSMQCRSLGAAQLLSAALPVYSSPGRIGTDSEPNTSEIDERGAHGGSEPRHAAPNASRSSNAFVTSSFLLLTNKD